MKKGRRSRYEPLGSDACKPVFYRRIPLATAAAWLLIASTVPASAQAAEPPKDLLRQVAANGSRFERERGRYTYLQRFRFTEYDSKGVPAGDYFEIRDVTFNPDGEREEVVLKGPFDRLTRIRLTDEDFRDLRQMQPFVLTEDTLWLYETRYQGEDVVNGRPCWVYRIRPRQLLEGQRLLDGRIWVEQQSKQVVQAGGLPLPQHFGVERSNLFPRFITLYEAVDGKFWFPVKTIADDHLAFPSGVQRVRYEIDYENYKRFSAEASISFEGAEAPEGR